MIPESSQKKMAVRMSGDRACDDSFSQFMISHPELGFERFAPKDDDELNERLGAGAFRGVLFHNLDGLLETLWKGHADLAKWDQAGVEIRFCEPPPGDWRSVIPQIHASLEKWRATQRRRQIIAATILSAITLGGMAVLFALLGPAK